MNAIEITFKFQRALILKFSVRMSCYDMSDSLRMSTVITN